MFPSSSRRRGTERRRDRVCTVCSVFFIFILSNDHMLHFRTITRGTLLNFNAPPSPPHLLATILHWTIARITSGGFSCTVTFSCHQCPPSCKLRMECCLTTSHHHLCCHHLSHQHLHGTNRERRALDTTTTTVTQIASGWPTNICLPLPLPPQPLRRANCEQ